MRQGAYLAGVSDQTRMPYMKVLASKLYRHRSVLPEGQSRPGYKCAGTFRLLESDAWIMRIIRLVHTVVGFPTRLSSTASEFYREQFDWGLSPTESRGLGCVAYSFPRFLRRTSGHNTIECPLRRCAVQIHCIQRRDSQFLVSPLSGEHDYCTLSIPGQNARGTLQSPILG
jgi:hypothetical protein